MAREIEERALQREVTLLVSLAGMGGVLVGVDLLIPAGLVLSTSFQTTFPDDLCLLRPGLPAAQAAGAAFGAALLLNRAVMDLLGRKGSLIIISLLALMGPVLLTLANNPVDLLMGRFLSGIAAGMVCVGVPVHYVADLAPSRQSQFYASLWQLAVGTGGVVGAVANWWLVDLSVDSSTGVTAWRYLAGLPGVVALLFHACTWMLVESPYWHLSRGAPEEEVLAKLVEATGMDDAELERDFDRQRTLRRLDRLGLDKGEDNVLFGHPQVGRRLMFASVLQVLSVAGGGVGLAYFGPEIFAAAFDLGRGAFLLQAALAGVLLLGMVPAAAGAHRAHSASRRSALALSALGMATTIGVAGLLLLERDMGVFGFKRPLERMPDHVFASAGAALLMLFALSLGLGVGSGMWGYLEAVFPEAFRRRCFGVSTVVGWVACLAVAAALGAGLSSSSPRPAAVLLGLAAVNAAACLAWLAAPAAMVPEEEADLTAQLLSGPRGHLMSGPGEAEAVEEGGASQPATMFAQQPLALACAMDTWLCMIGAVCLYLDFVREQQAYSLLRSPWIVVWALSLPVHLMFVRFFCKRRWAGSFLLWKVYSLVSGAGLVLALDAAPGQSFWRGDVQESARLGTFALAHTIVYQVLHGVCLLALLLRFYGPSSAGASKLSRRETGESVLTTASSGSARRRTSCHSLQMVDPTHRKDRRGSPEDLYVLGNLEIFVFRGLEMGSLQDRRFWGALDGRPVMVREVYLGHCCPREHKSLFEVINDEAQFRGGLEHDNIAPLLCCRFDEGRECFYLVNERCDMDLTQFLLSNHSMWLDHALAIHLAHQLAGCVQYLGNRRVQHPGLNCASVLLNMEISNQAPEVKLADLGMTAMMHQEYRTRVMGEHTVPYLAPETISNWNIPQSTLIHEYGTPEDAYAFGVILLQLMTRQTRVGPALARARDGGHRNLPDCPAAIVDLMLQCWHADPNQRPSFAQIRCVLAEHVAGERGGSVMYLPPAAAAASFSLDRPRSGSSRKGPDAAQGMSPARSCSVDSRRSAGGDATPIPPPQSGQQKQQRLTSVASGSGRERAGASVGKRDWATSNIDITASQRTPSADTAAPTGESNSGVTRRQALLEIARARVKAELERSSGREFPRSASSAAMERNARGAIAHNGNGSQYLTTGPVSGLRNNVPRVSPVPMSSTVQTVKYDSPAQTPGNGTGFTAFCTPDQFYNVSPGTGIDSSPNTSGPYDRSPPSRLAYQSHGGLSSYDSPSTQRQLPFHRINDRRRSTDHEVVPHSEAPAIAARRPAYLHSLALHQAEDILDQDSP